MKIYKMVCMVVDHDEIGAGECIETIHHTSYPNHWFGPEVMSVEEVDIGEWDDDHPSNTSERKDWFAKAFG